MGLHAGPYTCHHLAGGESRHHTFVLGLIGGGVALVGDPIVKEFLRLRLLLTDDVAHLLFRRFHEVEHVGVELGAPGARITVIFQLGE